MQRRAQHGAVLGDLAPALGISAGAFAVVAMAATFGTAIRASFAAIVFLFELTARGHEVRPQAGELERHDDLVVACSAR